jgi:hypothetical protein
MMMERNNLPTVDGASRNTTTNYSTSLHITSAQNTAKLDRWKWYIVTVLRTKEE